MTINAFPLDWPQSWKRTDKFSRKGSPFSTKQRGYANRHLTISDGVSRVLTEFQRMGISEDDLIISTNVKPRLDGLPRSGEREPDDPGVAVYWSSRGREMRCMAVDRYDRVADNLAAIAATLDAMRAIERHGGAEILERAYTGFTALPPPIASGEPWYVVLDVDPDSEHWIVEEAYRIERSKHHPDHGGDAEKFDRVQKAWEQYEAQR
jgi:hypothetical protein